MSVNSINDIEIDHFGSGIDYLATTSLGPCIGFVVLLDNNQHIFIEHRSSVYIPPLINLATVRLCFQNVAKHVSDLLPISSITLANKISCFSSNKCSQLQSQSL
ncbi:unnamed protein product [Rotaria sordida]|uniref:Uncharacterized protein n=2 Tax=Rotaria sordida TaxID=392033 RepID=A0A814TFD1_9BILA|nr:unnamed protein product [Rotaria sordida]